MRFIDKVILHHAAHSFSDVSIQTARDEINRWHEARGWNGIGYHYICREIGGELEFLEGRPLCQVGAHCRGQNLNSVGICVLKDLRTEVATCGDVRVVCRLIHQIEAALGRGVSVHGHSEYVNTWCPGPELVKHVVNGLRVHQF
jgi:N-acetylmuramoyl-L-alanine amidase